MITAIKKIAIAMLVTFVAQALFNNHLWDTTLTGELKILREIGMKILLGVSLIFNLYIVDLFWEDNDDKK